MDVINTDTNCTLGSIPVPQGVFEWPFHGTLSLVTSGGIITNVSVGVGDTLVIWGGGYAVHTGLGPVAWFSFGFAAVVLGLGVLAYARKIARSLSADNVTREI